MKQKKVEDLESTSKKEGLSPPDSGAKIEAKSQNEPINYYNQYCRLFLINTLLTTQLQELQSEKHHLYEKFNHVSKKSEEESDDNLDDKKKRIRRAAAEIARHYKCEVEGCHKSYGSEGSLNQHIKLKHSFLLNNESVQKESESER